MDTKDWIRRDLKTIRHALVWSLKRYPIVLLVTLFGGLLLAFFATDYDLWGGLLLGAALSVPAWLGVFFMRVLVTTGYEIFVP